MRTIPPALQASLDSGITTLARCWQVTRNDGLTMGFTDHDRAIVFEGVHHEPNSGFTPSAIESGTGLAADTHAVTGALNSARITETDIQRGLYDGAEVLLFLVDWQRPEDRVLLSRGRIGEIRRSGQAFDAEVTGLSDMLNRPFGRAYIHSCACRLGDTKCGLDPSGAVFTGLGAVTERADPQQLSVNGLSAFDDGWFTGGTLRWITGPNAGLRGHVKIHMAAGADAFLELWLAPAMPVTTGDTFEVTAGCDKTSGTCDEKFDNLLNFRGFPHIPGDDVAASYPSTGGSHDGGSLFNRG